MSEIFGATPSPVNSHVFSALCTSILSTELTPSHPLYLLTLTPPLSSHAYTLARLPLLPPPSSAQMPDFCLAPLKRTFPHTYRYFRSTLSEERPGAWGKGRRSKVTPTRWRAYRNGMHTAMGHARMLPWDAPDLCLLLYNVTAHGSHNREGVQCCSCHVTLLSPGIAATPTYVGQGGERSKKFCVEIDSLVSNEPRS